MVKWLVFVALLGIVDAAHKHHPKFPKGSEEYETSLIKKVACSSERERTRRDIIKKSRCGPPKEVFVYLEPQAAHEQVSPGAVWVKRCVGLCDYETFGSKCMPTKSVIREIPIRIYNVKTDKETCSTYSVEEHLSCGCCSNSGDECGENKVFNPPEPEYEVEPI